MHSPEQQNQIEDGPVTEMVIVNAFTRLIFGDECTTERELLIVQALRAVDASVLRDTPQELGQYLRSLGVREMIQLVSRVRRHILESAGSPAAMLEPAAPSANIGRPGHNGGAH